MLISRIVGYNDLCSPVDNDLHDEQVVDDEVNDNDDDYDNDNDDNDDKNDNDDNDDNNDKYDNNNDDDNEEEDHRLDGRTSGRVPLFDFEENVAQNASDLVVKRLGDLKMQFIMTTCRQ